MADNIIRIGRIEYTNVWPVFHGFDPDRLGVGGVRAEMTTQVPAELNRRMQDGTIDVAAISSYAYAQAADDLLLLPDLSVSAYGRVGSVMLFHRKPLHEVARGTIALTSSSATSINLLKIILAKRYGGHPEYIAMLPDFETMMSKADAALLIGDDAIRALRDYPEYAVTDLASEWTSWTGHWMTFAVWAVRRETALAQPEAVQAVYRAFLDSKRTARRDLRPVAEHASAQVGGPVDYWLGYFSQLSHEFGSEQQAGLLAYFGYAEELGLLPRGVSLHIWNDNKVAQVNE